jgi:hypothetical protein
LICSGCGGVPDVEEGARRGFCAACDRYGDVIVERSALDEGPGRSFEMRRFEIDERPPDRFDWLLDRSDCEYIRWIEVRIELTAANSIVHSREEIEAREPAIAEWLARRIRSGVAVAQSP